VDAVKKWWGVGRGGRSQKNGFWSRWARGVYNGALPDTQLCCRQLRCHTRYRIDKRAFGLYGSSPSNTFAPFQNIDKTAKKKTLFVSAKNAKHKEGRITWEAGRGGHHLPLADSCCDGPTRIEPAMARCAAAKLQAVELLFFLFFLLQEVVDRPGWFHEAPARIAGARRVDSEL